MAPCDVLVTGSVGFVGRHVLERALGAGLDARAAQGDLRIASRVEREVAASRPRAVIHLAAAPRGERDPWLVLKDDLAMASGLVSAMARYAPQAPLLVAGSAAQYGMGGVRAIKETDPTEPVSSYGAVKCVLERALMAAPLRGTVRVIFTRTFNHIGPGQHDDAPAGAWARQAVAAEATGGGTIRTGNLDVVRDFLDVRDVAEAYLALVRSSADGVVNVCSGVPVTLRSIVTSIVKEVAIPLAVEQDPALTRTVDPARIVGEPTVLSDATGWSPRISLRRSIRDLLDACRRGRANEESAELAR